MLRTILVVLCAFVTAAVMVFAKTPRPLADVTISPAPGGKAIKLSSFKGRPLVIAVISTECADCANAIQYLDVIQKEYKAKGVQIVGAAANGGAISTVGAFIDRYRPSFPIGVLSEDELKRLGDYTNPKERPYVPIFIFVDKKATVTFQAGAEQPFFKEVDKLTRALLDNMVKQ